MKDWEPRDLADLGPGAGTALLEPPSRCRRLRPADGSGEHESRASRGSRIDLVLRSSLLQLVEFPAARPIPGVQQKLAFLPPRVRGAAGSDCVPSRAYLVDRGEAIGESVEVVIVGVQEPFRPTDAVVLEPVELGPEEWWRVEDALGAGHGRRARVEAYCLQKERRAPATGTVLRIAPEAVQEAFGVERRILYAARAIRDAGRLHPNTPSRSYYHSVVQWAVWTRRQRYDRPGFRRAFLGHVRDNFARAGQPWSRSAATEVGALVDDRWKDVRQILRAALPDHTLP